jgi:hypothetical protein
LKAVCAFANTEGGVLTIGIRDKGEVIGVKDPHNILPARSLSVQKTDEDRGVGYAVLHTAVSVDRPADLMNINGDAGTETYLFRENEGK